MKIYKICSWILFGFFVIIFAHELSYGFFYWPTLVVILLMLPIVFYAEKGREFKLPKIKFKIPEREEEEEEELDFNYQR